MEVFIFPYEIKISKAMSRRTPSGNLEGLLIKVKDGDKEGYSCFQVLPGVDKSRLRDHIELARKGQPAVEFKLSLIYAEQDAQSRHNHHDDMAGAFQIENHFLISDVSQVSSQRLQAARTDNFKTLKIKMGRDIEAETRILVDHVQDFSGFNLRLDFNNFFSPQEFSQWWKTSAQSFAEYVEFCEDPCTYEDNSWAELASSNNIKLAVDCYEYPERNSFAAAEYLVLKPARMNVVQWLKKLDQPDRHKFVVTHYMDHPVGVAHAAAVAMKLKFFIRERLVVCGLLPLAETNLEDWELECKGPHILFAHDEGIGFSEKLHQLNWELLWQG